MKHPLITIIVTSLLMLFPLRSLAQSPQDIPKGGRQILADFQPSRLIVSGGEAVKHQPLRPIKIPAAKQKEAMVLQVQTLKRPAHQWSIQVQSLIQEKINKGDTALISFWARSMESSDESGRSRLNVYFQRSSAPWTKSYFRHLVLDETWSFYVFPFKAKESYHKDEAALYIALGFNPQTIQLYDLRVINYGPARKLDSLPITKTKLIYKGMEEHASWRSAASQRIEKYRKGDFNIKVLDAKGKPVKNRKLSIEMQQHAYPFGSAVVAKGLAGQSEADQKYQAIIAEHYNEIVFENDLKHHPWIQGMNAGPSAYFSRRNISAAMHWLNEHDIKVRGHTLLWGPIRKTGYNRLLDFSSPAKTRASKRKIESHMRDIIRNTYPQVSEWDVLNHPVARFGDKGQRLDHEFGLEFYADFIKAVRKTQPKLTLYVNEGNVIAGGGVKDEYHELVKFLKKQNATPDGIGFMCHFGESSLIGMDELSALLNQFGQFNLPLKATELDITTEDEEGQAAYLRDFMTLWFSHPKTSGIIMWGFWEARHWRPSAALYRRDFSIKPAGQAWINLVKKEWWTSESLVTDDKGEILFRGFYGNYVIKDGNQILTSDLQFTRDKQSISIQLK